MTRCVFTTDADNSRRHVCAVCGRAVLCDAPAAEIRATCRGVTARAVTAERRRVLLAAESDSFERWPCRNRAGLLGSISNGWCCGASRPVRVAACLVGAVCCEEPFVRGAAQITAGEMPIFCGECPHRVAPLELNTEGLSNGGTT